MLRYITILILMLSVPAGAGTLRVGLFRKEPPVSLRVDGPCVLRHDKGERVITEGKSSVVSFGERGVRAGNTTSPRITLEPHRRGGVVRISFGSRASQPYRGKVEVRSSGGKLLVVNHLDIEDYVRVVLPSEMPPDWPREALKAQAVVSRSFAEAEKSRHAKEGFDLCDLTHCQVYRSALWERAATDQAVSATRGETLVCGGRPVPTPFHSTCGGHTTGGFPSYTFLQPVKDTNCAASNHYRWKCAIPAEDLKKALTADGHPVQGKIRDVRVRESDSSGRAVTVEVIADTLLRITGDRLMLASGRHLGWNKIKSTLFKVNKTKNGFTFTGNGLGHGMGLCQWGARGMALKGKSYREILSHYFPKCSVRSAGIRQSQTSPTGPTRPTTK